MTKSRKLKSCLAELSVSEILDKQGRECFAVDTDTVKTGNFEGLRPDGEINISFSGEEADVYDPFNVFFDRKDAVKKFNNNIKAKMIKE